MADPTNIKTRGQKIKNAFTLGAMSTEQQVAYWDEHRKSVGIEGGITARTTMENYSSKRLKDLSDFDKIVDGDKKPLKTTTPDGKSITEKFGSDPDLVNGIKEVFAKTPATDKAISDFTKDVTNLHTLVMANPPQYSAAGIANVLQEKKSDALAAIKAQQAKELERLNDKFAPANPPARNEFREKIKAAMGPGTTEEQVNKVKDDMVNATKASHASQIKRAEAEFNYSIKKFYSAMQKEFDRIALLGDRYERDKQMRAAIDTLAAQRAANEPRRSTTVSIQADQSTAILRGIKVQDLDTINTLTGRPLTKNTDGSYSMKLSKDWIFFDRKARDVTKSVEKDLASLAHTIKATGAETITMELTAADPDKAKELGKKAYEAAIKAGFEPRDINIVVNGKSLTEKYEKGKLKEEDKLFDDEPSRLRKAKNEATKIAQEREGRVFNSPGAKAETVSIKQKLQEMRTTPPPPTGSTTPTLGGGTI
ncbi:coiled coil domain protein [Legionella donaldsonii]|uniref:Coiled coil domain protein n=1 Tax=Legionella donaldsonii TaxID=45060 RepID=A0A378J6S8_9GAMM|nr:hypothetical protein [Legionella donaldsonii]STX43514.1 coiled coil domain protein [Legionella donaldsonii]